MISDNSYQDENGAHTEKFDSTASKSISAKPPRVCALVRRSKMLVLQASS